MCVAGIVATARRMELLRSSKNGAAIYIYIYIYILLYMNQQIVLRESRLCLEIKEQQTAVRDWAAQAVEVTGRAGSGHTGKFLRALRALRFALRVPLHHEGADQLISQSPSIWQIYPSFYICVWEIWMPNWLNSHERNHLGDFISFWEMSAQQKKEEVK